MNTACIATPCPATMARFLLRFESLFQAGRGYAFACDERGAVNLQELPERQRRSYLDARNLVGLELGTPWVEALDLQ